MEAILISFNIVVTIVGFSFMLWTQRASHRETLEFLTQINANSARIADHTRHIADLVVQNGQALARAEPLTQQILTRLADEKAAH